MRAWMIVGWVLSGQVWAQAATLSQSLSEKGDQTRQVKERAEAITAKTGALAISGKLPTNDESLKLLQEIVQELAKINEQLKRVQADVDQLKEIAKTNDKKVPSLERDVASLKKTTLGGYLQYQWQDTQEGFTKRLGDGTTTGRTNSDGFQWRRIRLSSTTKIDPRTSAKVSFDMATGGNRLSTELRDAILSYDLRPDFQGRAGQMPMPLGYEIERSSSEREMPERAIYNRTLFAGERNRGVSAKFALDANSFVHAGLWNSLTITDPQQTAAGSFRNLNGTEIGFHAGARTKGKHYDAGIAGFFAHRPRFQYTDFVSPGDNATTSRTAPEGNRSMVFVDGIYSGIAPKVTVRGEAMFGRDRVPTLGTKRQTVLGSSATISGFPEFVSFTSVLGWQLQAVFGLNPRNSIAARFEYFDPDTGSGANSMSGLGIAFIHQFGTGAKLTISHEMFREEAFETRNNVSTIRLQYKL